MNVNFKKITHNPFNTLSQFEQAVLELNNFFYNSIKDLHEFYYFWNHIEYTQIIQLCSIVHSFQSRIYTDANIFALNLIFLAEGVVNLSRRRKSISYCIRSILIKHLSYEWKVKFIKSFLFSNHFNVNAQNSVNLTHVFCDAKKLCSSDCQIEEESLNKYVSHVMNKIYQIRSSAVHLGILPNFIVDDGIGECVRIYDKFGLRESNKFIFFCSTLKKSELENIFKTCIWKHLNRNI